MSAFDDIVWRALTGSHAAFALGTNEARRYAPGFSPIVGFANRAQPNVAALAPFCASGEHCYCDGWAGEPPAAWHVDVEDVMLKMVWDAPMPDDEAQEAIRLGPEHVAQALGLVGLTRPGPFGPRTLELGHYFGCFENGRLVAMAGERLCALPLREVSGARLYVRMGFRVYRESIVRVISKE